MSEYNDEKTGENVLKGEKIYTAFSLTNINEIKTLLSQNGIEYFVENENSSIALSHLGNIVPVAFWVPVESKEKALNLLEKNIKKPDEKRLHRLDIYAILSIVVICVLGTLTLHPDIPEEISQASFYISWSLFGMCVFYIVISKFSTKSKHS